MKTLTERMEHARERRDYWIAASKNESILALEGKTKDQAIYSALLHKAQYDGLCESLGLPKERRS